MYYYAMVSGSEAEQCHEKPSPSSSRRGSLRSSTSEENPPNVIPEPAPETYHIISTELTGPAKTSLDAKIASNPDGSHPSFEALLVLHTLLTPSHAPQ